VGAVPGGWAGPRAGARAARGGPAPAAKAATPRGRLMKKIDRQPSVSVSTPPASGPMAVAPPIVAPKTPSARARAAPENSTRNSGVPVANSTAPPTPCNARNRSSASAGGASAHASDPAGETAQPGEEEPAPAHAVTYRGRR